MDAGRGDATIAAGGVTYALFYPMLSGQARAEKRRKEFAAPVTARVMDRDAQARVKRGQIAQSLKDIESRMRNAAANLEFEEAARLRDELRRLEAMLIVADSESTLIITGNGDVLEPEHGIVAIGSGGAYAQSAAKALIDHTELSAEQTAITNEAKTLDGQRGTLDQAAMQSAEDIVAAVRQAVGEGVSLMIEVHGRLSADSAIEMGRRLAKYNPAWYEEPVSPHSLDLLAEVHSALPFPVAAGERLYMLEEFARLANLRACDVAQPDLAHCGGLWMGKKIAALCQPLWHFVVSLAVSTRYRSDGFSKMRR